MLGSNHQELVGLDQKLAVAATDVRISRPKLTFVVSSDKEGRLLDRNDHPFSLAPNQR